MRMPHPWIRLVAASATLLALSASANGAEVYASGALGFSSQTGDSSGFNNLLAVPTSGDDTDSSPVLGLALGMEMSLQELVPWDKEMPGFSIPYWPGRSIHFDETELHLPDWKLRVEAEGRGGRDYELFTNPLSPTTPPYTSEVSSWSMMANLWLEAPLYKPLNALFGRVPMLEPLSLFGGFGLGYGRTELETNDGIGGSGSDTSSDLAMQFGAGFGYQLTERVHWELGWRYLDMGESEVQLTDGVGSNIGTFSLDMDAHEFATSLRVNFYAVELFGH